jgi:Concanavalin A-like lectin/glucanases superfamily
MSASLVVLLPVILLGIVGVLCFVGCGLQTQGLGGFSQYSDTTVLADPAIVGYWPLSEDKDSVPAADRTGPSPNNGQYMDQTTSPPGSYPWPAYSVPTGTGPDVQSAAASGSIAFAQHGIVAGDTVQPANDFNNRTPCIVVDGCYVSVPFNPKVNPPTSFTVEAWVRVDWDKNAPHAWRFVLDARDFDPCTGFGIFAKADDNQPGVYHWAAVMGNGGAGAAGFTLAISDDPAITLNDPSLPAPVTYYLAVTYDGPSQTLILFVDGEQRGPKINPAVYAPNTTKPLWIGAAAPYVPMRPQAPGVVAAPLFPFVGAIQDVAIYNAALKSDVILRHYHNGNGVDP